MHAALSFNLLYGRSCMGVKMSKVKITDGFWKAEQELVRTEVIPYQWDALNDNVKDAKAVLLYEEFPYSRRGKQKEKGSRLQRNKVPYSKG